MIAIVFLTFLVYAAVLASLILRGDKRSLVLEMAMFLVVLMATTLFLVVYCSSYVT